MTALTPHPEYVPYVLWGIRALLVLWVVKLVCIWVRRPQSR